MSTRPSRQTTPTATWICFFTTLTVTSGPVLGIDGDIIVGEVAGPDGFLHIAALQINRNGDFFLVHHGLAPCLGVIIGPATRAHQTDVAQIRSEEHTSELQSRPH